MLKYLLILFLFLVANESKSQVNLLTLSKLEQRIAKGKDTTYVINFWATWCGPCVEELPRFEQLQIANKNKPLKVILISLDFKSKLKTEVIPFVEKNKLKTEVYVINEPDQQLFIEKVDKKWSGAIPATLFVNHKKQMRYFSEQSFLTYAELANKIESLKLTP